MMGKQRTLVLLHLRIFMGKGLDLL
ncbi:hypothetical protein MTR67_044172 [Solanum verrucosum]|uniref:Uncharacterized protein n=1 Tax=Solanum verrucosum TaxID=315347 RepID=A0AAF0UR12_SOLVR|nr:hypothetical protein MTR67_044172 [Solanum verrucosum]